MALPFLHIHQQKYAYGSLRRLGPGKKRSSWAEKSRLSTRTVPAAGGGARKHVEEIIGVVSTLIGRNEVSSRSRDLRELRST